MFSSNQSLPPPPSSVKPRNESLGAALPTYRTRPKAGAPTSSPFNVFENLSKPETRSQLVGLAKNPLVQKAVVAGAKNEAVRSAAISYAKDAVAPNKPQPKERTVTGSSVLGMAKQFENKPIMGQAAPSDSSFRRSQNSDFSFSQPNESFTSTMPSAKPMYPTLSAQDPFDFPPQLPSSNTSSSWAMPSVNNYSSSYTSHSTSLIDLDFGKAQKAPPARPPPPKIGSRSNPNLAALCPSPEPSTNEPHAIVKYPYNAAGADELTCKPNDLVLLKREVDGQWIYALNTRTGVSGIVPLSFLQVKVPLVPTFGQTMASSFSDYGLGRNVARALYDYNTGVDGDLKFNQGDLITVTERINNEWLRGELRGRTGIFPMNFVQLDGTSAAPSASVVPKRTAVALYDYNSGVPDDLIFKAGDVITITEEVSSEWLRGELHGRTGLVPITYVKY